MVPAANGTWLVNLCNSENYFTDSCVGKRVMQYTVSGGAAATGGTWDVCRDVGPLVAEVKSVSVTVTSGVIAIKLTSPANAKIDAIEIIPVASACGDCIPGPIGPVGQVGPPGPPGPPGSIGPPLMLGSGLLATSVNGIPGAAVDSAHVLYRLDELAGTHALYGASVDAPGVTYAAKASASILSVAPGSTWFLFPDVTIAAGATLNINSLGPIPLMKVVGATLINVTGGECQGSLPVNGNSQNLVSPGCYLIAAGVPVSAFVIH
jgi:hypothetical protein